MSEEDGPKLALRHSRVLFCGSRTWATDGMDIDPYDYSKGPQYDHDSSDAQLQIAVMKGLYERHKQRAENGENFVIIEGGAPGADSVAWAFADWNQMMWADVEHLHFEADWKRLGRKAGFVRNSQMLTQGRPNLVVAFTHDLAKSNGTRMMVDIARKAFVETYVVGNG